MRQLDPGGLHGVHVVVANWRDPWHSLAGGSERYAWECALALSEAGALVEFWTARDVEQGSRESRDSIEIHRLGGQLTFYMGVWARLLHRRFLRRSADLVIDMDCGIPCFTPVLLPRHTRVALVVHHVHQEQFRTALRRPMSDIGRFLEARAMPRVYRGVPTVAVSDSTAAQMRSQLGWTGEVQVLHNGNDPVDAVPPPSDGGEERVLIFGRLVAHKRVDVTLRALARVRQQRPQMRVDLVGAGSESETLGRLIDELGLGDIVEVHGFVPEHTKDAILSAARLHVCASDAEGWGQVVLEAAAHGVPTLGRDVPGIRDSVRHDRTGWLIPESGLLEREGTPLLKDLAEGIETSLEQLASPGVRAAMAQECRGWAGKFTWSRMHDEVVRLALDSLRSAR